MYTVHILTEKVVLNMKRKHIGSEVMALSNLLRRSLMDEPGEERKEEPTGMQRWVLGYIKDHSNTSDVFQKDIEAEFKVRRSTATGMLQLLEKNGYVRREPVSYDARLKKLSLTPKAMAFCEELDRKIETIELKLARGFTEEELEMYFYIMKKMKDNLE